ncbi:MAG: SurA N-terminal domain-containing protein [Patescibacteria group bacterium]|jgi:hypothetical protein
MATKKTDSVKKAKKPTAPVKAGTKVTKKVEAVKAETQEMQTPVSTSFLSQLKSRNFIIPVIVILLLGGFYALRNQFIVATVNGKPITRFEVIKELEKQGGKQVVSGLVADILVRQEAQKQGVTVEDSEISDEIKNIEDQVSGQGQNLDDLLAAEGMSRSDLQEQIRVQKLVEKMAGKDISVTDEEVAEYVEMNKAFFPENLSEEEINTEAKDQLHEEKLRAKIQEWVAQLHSNAKISYFRYL